MDTEQGYISLMPTTRCHACDSFSLNAIQPHVDTAWVLIVHGCWLPQSGVLNTQSAHSTAFTLWPDLCWFPLDKSR